MAAYSKWVARVGDAKNRVEFEGMKRKKLRDSPVFQEVQRIGDLLDNGTQLR